jgi:hypothetical protein
MQITIRRLAAALLIIGAIGSSHAADTRWIASWASSPLGGKIVIPGVPPDKFLHHPSSMERSASDCR